MTGEVNKVPSGGFVEATKFKTAAKLRMQELRQETIELQHKFHEIVVSLPTEVQEAYFTYKRLDAAEEKLYELTEKAEEGKIPYSEVTAQAQEVENLKRELAEAEAKIPPEYKQAYNTIKAY